MKKHPNDYNEVAVKSVATPILDSKSIPIKNKVLVNKVFFLFFISKTEIASYIFKLM